MCLQYIEYGKFDDDDDDDDDDHVFSVRQGMSFPGNFVQKLKIVWIR